jgi:hypothetical protein
MGERDRATMGERERERAHTLRERERARESDARELWMLGHLALEAKKLQQDDCVFAQMALFLPLSVSLRSPHSPLRPSPSPLVLSMVLLFELSV